MNSIQRILHRPFFIKLFNWEYWSFTSVYLLIYPVWFLLCLRARSLFFFNASNPSIKNGGFLCESKKDIISIIPPEYHPPTVFFSIPANGDMVLRDLQRAVLDNGCDLGIAFDGDADRMFLIDEQGKAIGGDMVTAMVAIALLKAFIAVS